MPIHYILFHFQCQYITFCFIFNADTLHFVSFSMPIHYILFHFQCRCITFCFIFGSVHFQCALDFASVSTQLHSILLAVWYRHNLLSFIFRHSILPIVLILHCRSNILLWFLEHQRSPFTFISTLPHSCHRRNILFLVPIFSSWNTVWL